MHDVEQSQLVVSVVVPTFGRPERLRVLLAELLQQDFPVDAYEIIVSDDGSPVSPVAAIEELARSSTVAVRCLTKSNGGPASARNAGAVGARGEYLLFVDDDMSVSPNFLRTMIETQREYGPAVVNCRMRWALTAEPEPFEFWYKRRVAEWTQTRVEDLSPLGPEVYQITETMITTQCLALRNEDFKRANGFDTDYPYGCEDQDLAARLGRQGLRAVLTTKTEIVHIETHNTLRKLCHRQWLGSRDTVRFIKRFAVEHHVGRPAIAVTNDPVLWRLDPAALILKKYLRRLITAPVFSALAFGGVRVLEGLVPHSAWLHKTYELIVGAYIQKGWRDGLKMHKEVTPLKEWDPALTS